MQLKYDQTIAERKQMVIKDMEKSGKFNYIKELNEEFQKIKQAEKERMSSFSFFKTARTEQDMMQEARQNMEIKMESKVANYVNYYENLGGLTNRIIVTSIKDFAKEMKQTINKAINDNKALIKEENDKFYQEIKKIAKQRAEEKIRIEQAKKEAYKIKQAAERQTALLKIKAEEKKNKEKNSAALNFIRNHTEQQIKEALSNKKKFYSEFRSATNEGTRIGNTMSALKQVNVAINNLSRDIRYMKNQQKVREYYAGAADFEIRLLDKYRPRNYDEKSVQSSRLKALAEAEKEMGKLTASRSNVESYLKGYQ
jgi:hypothetical protein